MNAFLHAINWKGLNNGDLFMILSIGGAIFLIMAWFADALLERISFGVILNTIILAVGSAIGLFALVQLDMAPTQKNYMHAILACFASSAMLLVILSLFRRPV